MAERWFFALWPDEAARAGLAAGSAGLIPPGARAAHPRDLHLTLVFLGELGPERLGLAAQAADTLGAGSVDLRVDLAGYFPGPRVLWCGPAEPSRALLDLHARLCLALLERDLPTERRPYRPHITLARKAGRGPLRDWGRPVAWTARELVLARGLAGQVPRYAAWRRWPLVPGSVSGPVPDPLPEGP